MMALIASLTWFISCLAHTDAFARVYVHFALPVAAARIATTRSWRVLAARSTISIATCTGILVLAVDARETIHAGVRGAFI